MTLGRYDGEWKGILGRVRDMVSGDSAISGLEGGWKVGFCLAGGWCREGSFLIRLFFVIFRFLVIIKE